MPRLLIVLLLAAAGHAWARAEGDLRADRTRVEKIANFEQGFAASEQAFHALQKSRNPMAWDFHSLMVYFATFKGDYSKASELLQQRPDAATLSAFANYYYRLAQGRAKQFQGELNQAKEFYEECYKYADKLDNIAYAVTPVIALAFINSQQGNSTQVIEYLGLLQKFEKDASDEIKSIIFAESGGLYFDNEDYAKAIVYGKKAVDLAERGSNFNDISAMHANLGLYYAVAGDSSSALKHRLRALDLSEKIGNQSVTARRVLSVGDTYLVMKDFPKAYAYLKDLPGIFDEGKEPRYKIEGRRTLAAALDGLQRYKEALALYREAEGILQLGEKSAKNDQIMISILDKERQNLASMKVWDAAYGVSDRLLRLERRVTEDQNQRGMNEFRIKYDTAIKDKENEQLAAKSRLDDLALEKERQTNRYYLTITLTLGGFVVILGGLLLYIVRILRHLKRAKALTDSQAREIAVILARIDQAIFMVQGSSLTIQPQMSSYARNHFSVEAGGHLPDFIAKNFELNKEDLSILVNILGNSIDMSDIGFSIDSSKLPKEIRKRDNTGLGLFEVDWVPMVRSDDQTIEGYLVCLRDVSELRKMQVGQQNELTELNMIGRLVSCGRENFRGFRKSVTAHLIEMQDALGQERTAVPDEHKVRRFRQELHTIKGLARMLQFHELSSLCHEIEDYLLNGSSLAWLQQQLDRIQSVMQSYASLASKKLDWDLDEQTIVVDRGLLMQTVDQLRTLVNQDPQHSAGKALEELHKRLDAQSPPRLQDTLRQAMVGLGELAREPQKPEPALIISGVDPEIDDAWRRILPGIIQHLLRNSLDHGLEAPSIRLATGKAAAGKIHIDLRTEGDGLLLVYTDDGAGLDLARIEEKAVRIGLLQSNSQWTAGQIAELIFVPGFSTASRASEISGRGVGMDAVRSMVASVGGQVDIVLTDPQSLERKAQPVQFRINMPRRVQFQERQAG